MYCTSIIWLYPSVKLTVRHLWQSIPICREELWHLDDRGRSFFYVSRHMLRPLTQFTRCITLLHIAKNRYRALLKIQQKKVLTMAKIIPIHTPTIFRFFEALKRCYGLTSEDITIVGWACGTIGVLIRKADHTIPSMMPNRATIATTFIAISRLFFIKIF